MISRKRRSKRFPLLFLSVTSVAITLALSAVHGGESPRDDGIFAKDNLVAWCIVPFDAKKRGPAERAEMLKRLGITKLAYDWRDQHIPTFEEEILNLKKQNIELFAYWSPASQNRGYESMMHLIDKYGIHPQIWMIAPSAKADSEAKRVEVNARAMLPFLNRAKKLGCKFALYNHGGWSGEPDHLIAMVQWLRGNAGTQDVGIVYNFHHGHEHMKQFPAAFRRMVPYLFCLNLNGMTPGGPMVLPLGTGTQDLQVLRMIRDSGYRGPIGILDHRGQLDAEESLRENLEGLEKLRAELTGK